MADAYPMDLTPTDEEIENVRALMMLLGLVQNCRVHNHAKGEEHITISRKGAILLLELVDFLADDQLLEIAAKRKGGKSVH